MLPLCNQSCKLQIGLHLGAGAHATRTTHTHTTHTQMILLLYYYRELWDVRVHRYRCESVCYYVELRLILLLVMCLSYRYGRQSTTEHNYPAPQKSLCPQGKTEQRETVMLQAIGWDMHIGIAFITVQTMEAAYNSETVRL